MGIWEYDLEMKCPDCKKLTTWHACSDGEEPDGAICLECELEMDRIVRDPVWVDAKGRESEPIKVPPFPFG